MFNLSKAFLIATSLILAGCGTEQNVPKEIPAPDKISVTIKTDKSEEVCSGIYAKTKKIVFFKCSHNPPPILACPRWTDDGLKFVAERHPCSSPYTPIPK